VNLQPNSIVSQQKERLSNKLYVKIKARFHPTIFTLFSPANKKIYSIQKNYAFATEGSKDVSDPSTYAGPLMLNLSGRKGTRVFIRVWANTFPHAERSAAFQRSLMLTSAFAIRRVFQRQ
jgi:hypothetical protein